VIGALTGRIDGDEVFITNCFTVPHTEEDQVSINIDLYQGMKKLHAEVYPMDQIVGWYTTGAIRGAATLIHDFFHRELNDQPVLLTVDPSMGYSKGAFPGSAVQVHYAHAVQLGEKGALQRHFRPMDLTIVSAAPERVLVSDLQRQLGLQTTSQAAQLSDLDALERTLETLLDTLSAVSEYVTKAAKGGKGDPAVARALEEALALLPHGGDEQQRITALWTRGLQDALMAAYVATLARTHLHLQEHLKDFNAPQPRSQDDN